MNKKKPNLKAKVNETSYAKKDFYKRLLYIGLCIITISIFADEKGTYNLVLLPFFLTALWNLIMIIRRSQHIIDAFSPPKTQVEKTVKPFDQFVSSLSSILFIVGLISQMLENRNFDNTIHGTKLFWTAGLIGIGLAMLLTIILKTTHPSVYYESKRRYTVHFGVFLGLFLLTTATAGFINHHFADKNKVCKSYTIIRKETSGGKTKEYYINLKIDDNNEERFSVGKTRFERFNEGEEIELCTVNGKFGFDFVTDFNKLEK